MEVDSGLKFLVVLTIKFVCIASASINHDNMNDK